MLWDETGVRTMDLKSRCFTKADLNTHIVYSIQLVVLDTFLLSGIRKHAAVLSTFDRRPIPTSPEFVGGVKALTEHKIATLKCCESEVN